MENQNLKEALDLTYGSEGEKVIVTKSFLLSIKKSLQIKSERLSAEDLRNKMREAIDLSAARLDNLTDTKIVLKDVFTNIETLSYIVHNLE